MQITVRAAGGAVSEKIARSFYRHMALFADQIKADKVSLEFSDRHETLLQDNVAVLRINPKDTVFQDAEVIDAFVCQELIRLKVRRQLELPGFLEDIVCGRAVAQLYPREYFQLCYLEMLKHKKLRTLQEFLEANKCWLIFAPIDAYNSEFLKNTANRIKHDRRLERLCAVLFNCAKSSLSRSENLNNAAKAYENLMSHAGD